MVKSLLYSGRSYSLPLKSRPTWIFQSYFLSIRSTGDSDFIPPQLRIVNPLFCSHVGILTEVSIRRYSDVCHGGQGSVHWPIVARRVGHMWHTHTKRNISGYIQSQQTYLQHLVSKTNLLLLGSSGDYDRQYNRLAVSFMRLLLLASLCCLIVILRREYLIGSWPYLGENSYLYISNLAI